MQFIGSSIGGGGGQRTSIRGFKNVHVTPQVSKQSSNYYVRVIPDAGSMTWVTPFGSYSSQPQSLGNLAMFQPGWFSMPTFWSPYNAVGPNEFTFIRRQGQELWINRQNLKPVPIGKLSGPDFVLPNTLLAQ